MEIGNVTFTVNKHTDVTKQNKGLDNDGRIKRIKEDILCL